MATAKSASDIDLSRSVVMKGESWQYSEYVETLKSEQLGALNYLNSSETVWSVPDSLQYKVNESGTILPFFGDTTVFELSPVERDEVISLIDLLEPLRGVLSEHLDPNQLHLTLHDLSNSPQMQGELRDKMANNQRRVKEIFKSVGEYLKLHPEHKKIKMVSTNSFPCLNISILLGFAPKDESDFKALINLYNFFDDVVYLNYWLRPHITLSYFRPRSLNHDEIIELSRVLKEINTHTVEIELDVMELLYQHFYHMNDYRTQFSLRDTIAN